PATVSSMPARRPRQEPVSRAAGSPAARARASPTRGAAASVRPARASTGVLRRPRLGATAVHDGPLAAHEQRARRRLHERRGQRPARAPPERLALLEGLDREDQGTLAATLDPQQ